jgi:hypothetical protein
MSLGSTQPLTEMSTRNLPGKGGGRVRLKVLLPSVSRLPGRCENVSFSWEMPTFDFTDAECRTDITAPSCSKQSSFLDSQYKICSDCGLLIADLLLGLLLHYEDGGDTLLPNDTQLLLNYTTFQTGRSYSSWSAL